MRLLLGLFLLSISSPARSRPPAIEVAGSAEFVSRVRRALELLEKRAPEDYARARRHLRRIEEGERSGMDVYAPEPTLTLGSRTVAASPTWLAGVIVHDAAHAARYFGHPRYRRGAPDRVPAEAWTGVRAEREANRAQGAALRSLGAPAAERDYLASLDGTHFDLDGDGRYTPADYVARNW